MFNLILSLTFTFISFATTNYLVDKGLIGTLKPKTEVLSEIAPTNTSTPTPSIAPTATNTPTPEPTKVVYRKEEVVLFDVQWEYRGFPHSCYSYAMPQLKEFEKKVVESTKAYRDCDETPIEEAYAKGYVCTVECPDSSGTNCKTVCPESATRHIEECQAPAKPIWNQWNEMKEKYCTQIIPKPSQ